MNAYQTKLFTDLQKLTDNHDRKKRIFFHKDHTFKDKTYRIFNYQLANYSQFCLPNALECRGHMFEIDENEKPVRLASLPVPKFFNIGENPFTQNLDFDGARQIMRKEDGSLISTLLTESVDGNCDPEHGHRVLHFKSKASLTSNQAVDCLNFSNLTQNLAFKKELFELEKRGFTTNLEWTSPANRIVLSYSKDALVVLCIRNKQDGEYLEKEHLSPSEFPETLTRWVEVINDEDPSDYISKSYQEQGIEGYVVQLKSGQFCKAKTEWYLSLHRTRDCLEGQKLFNCVLNESTDDLKSLYSHDKVILSHIEKFEDTVLEILCDLQDRTSACWERKLGKLKVVPKSESKRVWEVISSEFTEGWERNIMNHFLKNGGQIDEKEWKVILLKNWKNVNQRFPVHTGLDEED